LIAKAATLAVHRYNPCDAGSLPPDMPRSSVTILCLASYFKGNDFIRECHRLGARVLLVTREALRDLEWPRDCIDELLLIPDLTRRDHMVNGVSWLARRETIDRIVALDEFDLEMASTLREHMRLPGMGESTVRFFRDKLAMRMQAEERGLLVPEFVSIFNYDRIREFFGRVPGPWFFKPRHSASAIGIRKITSAEELWPLLDELGDRQSYHLLERYVPGDVFHVDAIAWDGKVVFAEAHGYFQPPFDVYHGGGVFCTRTLDRGSEVSQTLLQLNERIVTALGMTRGALHTEFIRGRDDGRFYFLESAARVGGANIVALVEAATGLNVWREWARVEVASAGGDDYAAPVGRTDHAGLLISLARQEWPDLSAYDAPEISWRLSKRHHAGLVVASPSHDRVETLLAQYVPMFQQDFFATLPAPLEATE
jgi:biotin carboxylase